MRILKIFFHAPVTTKLCSNTSTVEIITRLSTSKRSSSRTIFPMKYDYIIVICSVTKFIILRVNIMFSSISLLLSMSRSTRTCVSSIGSRTIRRLRTRRRFTSSLNIIVRRRGRTPTRCSTNRRRRRRRKTNFFLLLILNGVSC